MDASTLTSLSPLMLIGIWVASQILLFAARTPAHRALSSLGQFAGGGLRLVSRWLRGAAAEMQKTNREVLLEAGRLELEKKLDREFVKLESGISKHLKHYPDLHRKLDSSVTALSEDMDRAAIAPREVPGWPQAVKSVTELPDVGERSGKRLLEEIKRTAVDAEKKALKQYQETTSKRHKILSGMGHHLRDLRSNIGHTLKATTAAFEATTKIDGFIDKYERIRRQDRVSERLLASEAIGLFAISLLISAIAIGGAFVNFQLIALPMSELVPAGTRIAGQPVSTIAALVIVLMEAAAGIFLMECLGITDLLPKIGRLSPGKRRLLLGIAFFGLLILACIESSLAILREQIVAADLELKQALAGAGAADATVAAPVRSMIPVVGQAVLGFILPWILAMIAVPLEMLLSSSRYVGGRALAAGAFFFGTLLRLISHSMRYVARGLTALFDVYIALPLWIEKAWRERQGRGPARKPRAEPTAQIGVPATPSQRLNPGVAS